MDDPLCRHTEERPNYDKTDVEVVGGSGAQHGDPPNLDWRWTKGRSVPCMINLPFAHYTGF